MKPTALVMSGLVLALALALAGCSSGGSGDGPSPSSGKSAGSPSSRAVDPTITKARICGRLDAKSIATAIGAENTKFHQNVDLAAGQKYQAFPGDKQKLASISWRCGYTTYPPGKVSISTMPDSYISFSVSIFQKQYTKASMTADIKRIKSGRESSDEKTTCTQQGADYFGSTGQQLSCTTPGNAKRFVSADASVFAYGVFGSTFVVCGSSFTAQPDKTTGFDAQAGTLKEGTPKACADVLAALSE